MILPTWVAPVGIGLALIGSHWFAYSTGADHERTRQQLVIAGTSNAALVVARDIETAHSQSTVEAVRDAQSDISAIPDVRPELDRVRNTNAELRRQLSSAADAAERGQAATRAAMVLSELLDRSAARNVELAERYDRALIAGNLCTSIADDWQARNAPHKP